MTELPRRAQNSGRRLRRIELILAAATVLSVAAAAWGYFFYYPRKIGPEQPIHFSHRVHAGTKQISCFF